MNTNPRLDAVANRGYEATIRAAAAQQWINYATGEDGGDFPTEIRAAIGLLQESLRWWFGEQDAS